MKIIEEIIYPALEEATQFVSSPELLKKDPNTTLYGANSAFDSLAFVNFIVLVEERLMDLKNVQITLVDEKAMSLKHSPFRTVQTLAEYIENKINDPVQ